MYLYSRWYTTDSLGTFPYMSLHKPHYKSLCMYRNMFQNRCLHRYPCTNLNSHFHNYSHKQMHIQCHNLNTN